jgi:hypothetical protein
MLCSQQDILTAQDRLIGCLDVVKNAPTSCRKEDTLMLALHTRHIRRARAVVLACVPTSLHPLR